jgi:L-threonylcarbamoyladenylate synthase
LFAALHAMEEDENVENIYIERVEEKGLGIAIMDRIKKAAYQYTQQARNTRFMSKAESLLIKI